jgi:hypothetical protein
MKELVQYQERHMVMIDKCGPPASIQAHWAATRIVILRGGFGVRLRSTNGVERHFCELPSGKMIPDIRNVVVVLLKEQRWSFRLAEV